MAKKQVIETLWRAIGPLLPERRPSPHGGVPRSPIAPAWRGSSSSSGPVCPGSPLLAVPADPPPPE